MHRQRSRHGYGRHEMRGGRGYGRGRHRVRRGDVRSAILALLDDRPIDLGLLKVTLPALLLAVTEPTG